MITDLRLNQHRIIGIDLGLCNLVTVANNVGVSPFIIKGGMVKSLNQYYNKHQARYRSITDTQGYTFTTRRIHRLTMKRNNKIKDLFHKVSQRIITFCIANNIGTILVGYNSQWKQKIRMGKRNNQNFVQIPFFSFLHMVKYKAMLVGIEIKLVDEAYTSKCSFLDNESINYHENYVGRRIKRGLFQSASGQLINADVNGAYNIIRKAAQKPLLRMG